jgi:2,3-bisphosphoglycerate-dependent phosphoglycerate mutase
VALTQRGVVEAVEAGQVFLSHNLNFRKCHVSLLTRSIVTAHRSLEAAGVSYTPLEYDWRWNERHYGALQGLSKERTAVRLGREKVMKWRRSYEAQPALMTEEHPHYQSINQDPRYRRLPNIPKGESLQDCQVRVVEAWKDLTQEISSIEDDDFDYSLLVAHANTLRALVMHLDDINVDHIEDLNIPTAIPFFYDIDKRTGEVVRAAEPGIFGGTYITDERKQRSFLERRRAANDPWLWALHDHQVATSLLSDEGEGLDNIEEARHNTELFAPGQTPADKNGKMARSVSKVF